MATIHCCVCGRQVVSYPANDDKIISIYGAKAGFRADEVFCRECGSDLDENGLFPEEWLGERNAK